VTIQSESALPAALHDRWPRAPRYANVNGWRMHYVDQGKGHPVVLLHGNPTLGVPLPRHDRAPRQFGAPRDRARYDRIWPVRKTDPRTSPLSRWAHSESDGAHAPVGPKADHACLPRLRRTDRVIVCHEQSCSRSCAHHHQHLGTAHAAGRISHSDFSMADDARPADRPLPPGKSLRARRTRCLPLGGRSRAVCPYSTGGL